MKVPGFVLAMVTAATPMAAQSAPRVAETLRASELAKLEAVRREVWVNWFSGDTASLRRVLTPELIAISPDSPHFQSLTETLAGSAWYKESGGKLMSVTFDSTQIHRFGDVVVMFSRYEVETVRSGARGVQKGRATEVFVRVNGAWVHTSWHLDVVE